MNAAWREASFENAFADISAGSPKVKLSEYLPAGSFPVIDQGEGEISGYTDDAANLARVGLPVILFGDHTRKFKYVDRPFCVGADGVKILKPAEFLDARYAFHFLKALKIESAGYSRHFKFLKRNRVWFPVGIPEQRRIAAILDKVHAIVAKRRNTLEILGQLGESIFWKLFHTCTSQSPLSDLVQLETGLIDPQDERYADLPHIGPENIATGTGELLPCRTAREDGVFSGKFPFQRGDILYSKIRPYLNKVALAPFRGVCSADVYVLRPRSGRATKHFLWYALRQSDFLRYAEGLSNRANIPKLNRDQLLAYVAPCPEVSVQKGFERKSMAIAETQKRLVRHFEESNRLLQILQNYMFRPGAGLKVALQAAE